MSKGSLEKKMKCISKPSENMSGEKNFIHYLSTEQIFMSVYSVLGLSWVWGLQQ